MSVTVCALKDVFEFVNNSFVVCSKDDKEFHFSSVEGEDVPCPLTGQEKHRVKSLIKDFIHKKRSEEAKMVFNVGEKSVKIVCCRNGVRENISLWLPVSPSGSQ